MFRELTRKKQALSREACVELLRTGKRGVLSVQGDDGYPYGMPMNHFYCEEDGKLYFHCGRGGHRLDALKRSDKVSFCVYNEGYRKPGAWPLYIDSVIVFGRMEITEDPSRTAAIADRLCRKFTQDEAYIRSEIEKHAHHTVLLVLTPEHICGKSVEES